MSANQLASFMEIPFYGKTGLYGKIGLHGTIGLHGEIGLYGKIGLMERSGAKLNEELALREGAGSAHGTEFKRTGHSSGLLAQRPGMGVSAKGRRLARSSGLVVGAVLKLALALEVGEVGEVCAWRMLIAMASSARSALQMPKIIVLFGTLARPLCLRSFDWGRERAGVLFA